MKLNVKLAFLGLLIALFYVGHLYDKQAAVRAAKASVEASYEKKLHKAAEDSRKKQESLQNQIDLGRQSKDDEIRDISNKLAVAVAELRKRKERPATPPANPATGETCTGRELYREDAEFLTGEAARAEQLIVERDYYYEQYEKVRNTYGRQEASN